LKKMILIAVICLGVWAHYHQNFFHSQETTVRPTTPDAERLPRDRGGAANAQSRFHCDGRQYCSQMTSRAEAEYFTRHCPHAKMDGDHDGIPCERDSRW